MWLYMPFMHSEDLQDQEVTISVHSLKCTSYARISCGAAADLQMKSLHAAHPQDLQIYARSAGQEGRMPKVAIMREACAVYKPVQQKQQCSEFTLC